MAHAYTSLSRAKMAIGGKLPPMTEIVAFEILDPTFTIGLGALQEDEERGLRCPVRGCGKWFHCLSQHLTTMHADVGGKLGVMDALELPRRAKLVSSKYVADKKQRWKQLDYDERSRQKQNLLKASARMHELWASGVYRRRPPLKGMELAGWRNHRNTCEAQMREPLLALAEKLGRSPTMKEVSETVSEAFAWHCISVYGNWSSALSALGFEAHKPGVSPKRQRRASREHVVASLRDWHTRHGTLPTSSQAQNPNRVPLIPCMETIQRAFSANSWSDAMKAAAREIGVAYKPHYKRPRPNSGRVLGSRYKRKEAA